MSGEASESISSIDLVFGTDLFEETMATESIVSQPAMEGVGAKIWGAIKSVFNAIANFFKNLFKRAVKTESSIKSSQRSSSSNAQLHTKANPTQAEDIRGKEKGQKEEFEKMRDEGKRSLEETKARIAKEEEDRKKEKQKAVYARFIQLRDRFIAQNEKDTIEYANILASAVKTASNTSFKTIMTKISATIKAVSKEAKIRASATDMSLNRAIYDAASQKETKKRMDDLYLNQGMSNDIKMLAKINEALGELVNRCNTELKRLKESREKNAEILRRYSDTVSEAEKTAQAIERGIISKDQSSKIDRLDIEIIKEIKSACKGNSDFCNAMIKECESNESRLNSDGRDMFELCKKYMEASKYYNNLSIRGLSLFNMHETYTPSIGEHVKPLAYEIWDYQDSQAYWHDDD